MLTKVQTDNDKISGHTYYPVKSILSHLMETANHNYKTWDETTGSEIEF